MSVQGIVYLVNKRTRHITYAGAVPETYGNITGLKGIDYAVLRDLGANFPDEAGTYNGLGFLTEEEALSIGVSPADIEKMKKAAWALEWESLADERYNLIADVRWRIERHEDEVALGNRPTEDILPIRQYVQAIRDLPKMYPNPFDIVWPAVPA